MAMSFGQHKADGFSHGPMGHGGIHRVGGHGSHASAAPMSNPHTQGSNEGHTMGHEHGGDFGMGC